MRYSFLASDAQGQEIRGILEANSESHLRDLLREKKMTLLAARQRKNATGLRCSRLRINDTDLSLMTRQLATMVASSMPLDEALHAVAHQSEKPAVAHVVQQLREMVVSGLSFEQALLSFPHIFERFYCAMVAAGEASGYLNEVLLRLAQYIEKRQIMKNKLAQVLLYPAVLTLVTIGVVTILLTSVVPQVMSQFIQMKVELPWTTRLLLTLSDSIRDFGVPVAAVLVGGLMAWRWSLRKPENMLCVHRRMLRIPIVGRLARESNAARYAKTLSILTASAVPLLDSMRIAARVLANSYARQQLTDACEQVYEGKSLHQALSATRLFSPMMNHMIAAGERSGELNQMLEHAAALQDEILNHRLTLSLGIFEQSLIIVMASAVLFIIMSILQPILQLNTMVG
ncbi:type II secretion system inner membrane protein GspF [Pantoea stewartii]|uniref:General secretion pathway protein F n=1 Tax=Pantoea stewartii subsp. stewartii DC283 TaxID=660596 RepID=H3RKR7_PANSE|nr:type II secretion system inner membrane protein GspF [Pantoea stewartii]ARF52264.1 type II secretion system protein GspF [Pantoea stewartii subsp. stewartii DC283]EHT97912.1 general secretion pathway protein F [Pantoea stewartii subsp. stewartii DC283]KAB0556800.1 type II secretion system protein GspF [Pantoea stewartii subsp. stewartii]